MEDLVSAINRELNLKKKGANEFSPLVLAYIGDGVFDLIIRTMVINRGNMQVNKMHIVTSSIVKAKSQATMIEAIEDKLTETELAVYKRGRNAKSHTSAKNASVIDYRKATGFEALLGYLYINGENERLMQIVKMGLVSIGEIN